MAGKINLTDQLKKYFGFDNFKGNQEPIIQNLLDGNDTFVLMPTGGGKSLCYQLPSLLMEGTAIVISPLIALMKNQVDAMRNFSEEDGVAHFINSSLNKGAIDQVRSDILAGKTKLLYVAPESLTKEENVEFLRSVKISFYAVDEAHCISEWGHDFRPEYRRIRPIINEIGKAPLIALTATATPKVQHDIQKNLGMVDAHVFKSSFNRPNLYYEVRPKTQNVDKDIIKFIKNNPEKSGIIYCLSRKKVEELAEILQANGINARAYHAGMDSATRTQNQDNFLMEKIDVIVATIAFGMVIIMNNEEYLENLEKELIDSNEEVKDIEAAKKYAKNLLNLGLPVIFDKQHFALLVGRELSEITKMMAMIETNYYHEAKIVKKSGKMRTLNIPAVSLRLVQKWILDNILYKIRVSQYCNGFCKKKSICTNAQNHLNQDCIVNMDMSDFFPSISQKQIFRIFYYYGYTVEVSYMLARLCTYDGYLPQGAPTSPYLSNIACLKLDKRLAGLAKKYESTYSRYADDITFSGKCGIQKIIPVAEKIIQDEGFSLNVNKTRIAYYYQRQEVTGINVNGKKMHVDKRYVKGFCQEIYYCEKFGVHDHLQHIKCNKHFYKEHMYGKAYYINMVDKGLGRKLLSRLDNIDWDD